MLAAALGAIAASGSARAEPARRLTFAEAVALTLSASPDVELAREAIGGAEARAAGTRARRLPVLRVEAVGNLYTEPYQVDFGGALFTLHEQTTSLTQVKLTQPLTGLAYLTTLVGAAGHDTAAARAELDRARLDAGFAAGEAFVRVLSARAAAEVARQAVIDVTSSLERARLLRRADTVTDVDVLRLESAKAAADQAAVRAEAAVAVATAQLAVAIGLDDGAALDPVDDLPVEPPALALSLDDALARAIAARPELRAAREQLAGAAGRVTAAKATYLPDVRAVATYQHTTGVEPFQPADEEFVGLQLGWNLWDWGGTRAAVREAEHTRNRARVSADALADKVRVEVRRRWLEAKANHDNLAAARTQLASAEEAHRLQQVRFDAGAATTTDVLDADTDVARARLQSAQARFDYYLSLNALARAVGDLPGVK